MRKQRKDDGQCYSIILSLFPCRNNREFSSSNKMNQRGLLDFYLYLKKILSSFSFCLLSLFDSRAHTLFNKLFIFLWCWIEDDYCHSFSFLSRRNHREKSFFREVYEKETISDRHSIQEKSITYSLDFFFLFLKRYISL